MKHSAVKSKKRPTAAPRPASPTKRAKRRATKSKPAGAGPLSRREIVLLRESFARIEPQAGIAAMIFYRNLFTLDPALRPLFHTTIELQGRKLMDSLAYTVATLEEPEKLVPALEAMGRRHVTYGTKNEHYATVVQAMLQTLDDCLEQSFTPAVKAAWVKALGFVSATMQQGAHDVQVLLDEQQARVAPGKCPFGH